MARTVAVTGASGFIGRRLIERLCRDGVKVRALVRSRSVDADVASGQLTAVRGSMADRAALEALVDDVDAVVHLAGLIKARRRREFFEVNAQGVSRLAVAMASRGTPPKLVLISSLAAREPALSSYAASKRCGEAALLDAGRALPWTVLRPPAVYGPGDRQTLAFFKGVKCGIGATLGSETARFSLLHVDDLAAAIALMAGRGVGDGLVLELDDGTEGGHSWHSMIALAERAMGVTARRVTVPPKLLTTIAYANAALRVLPGCAPMLTPEKARELTHEDWVADGQAILAATSWRPSIPADRGFAATIAWYQLHGWL